MKKVININFHGRVIPIEETSYDLLKQYTDSLRNYFSAEEGRDEIINDIESRIAELFDERLKAGATCITDEDITAIINNMGRPQDFADADDSGSAPKTAQPRTEYQQAPLGGKKLYRDENNKVLGGVCSGIAAYFDIEPIIVRLLFVFSGIGFLAYIFLWAFVPGSHTVYNGVKKRLYRDPENQMISGVCSGLAAYFNINVWIPRLLFLLPSISFIFKWGHFWHPLSFSFSPGSVIVYIILWMVLPEAKTTSEKLEMRGEKVDMNSIKNTVVEEIREVKERLTKKGGEVKDFAQQKGTEFSGEVRQAARRTGSSLGNIIVFIAKMFGYFIIGVVALALIVGLFGTAVLAIGLFPLKDYIVTDGWQNLMAWGSLIFFIGVPVVGVITWIIRRIAKVKKGSKLMRYSVISLWIVGWFCFISLIASVGKDFKSSNTTIEEFVSLANPVVNKLQLLPSSTTKYYTRNSWLRFEPFASIDEDTVYVNNMRMRVVRSNNDSFRVSVVKFCNGFNRKYADTLAAKMNFNVQQIDSILYVDRGIPINKDYKFRNQQVIVTVYVPVGKVINISKQLQWDRIEHISGPWTDTDWWDMRFDNEEVEGWSSYLGQDLIMKADGLYTIDGKSIKEEVRRNNRQYGPAWDDNGDEREHVTDSILKAKDSVRTVNDKKLQKTKDSLEKVKEQIEKKIEKIDQSNTMNDNPQPEHACTFMFSI
jgi:phage shock protein PspC (stress-responsive transcriptional regulator)